MRRAAGHAALRRTAAVGAGRAFAESRPGMATAVVALAAVSLYARSRALHAGFWVDEGISVGIASHPLADIPGLLRHDGSPPLYYMLLHAWMGVFGSGEATTRALSLVFALAAIPAALWAGWSLAGRRAGLACAVLAAASPFLTVYAQETRMYSLAALLAMLTAACFCHAFVRGRRRYVPLFALALAALLYTHNWGLYLAAGGLAALVPCLLRARRRGRLAAEAAAAYAAVGVMYLPWLPRLLDQAAHTGAPWSARPGMRAAPDALQAMLGPREAAAFLVAGGAGALGLTRRPARLERALLGALAVMLVAAFAAAFLVAQHAPGWAVRYLATLVGPALLAIGILLARSGGAGTVALAAAAFWGLVVPAQVADKSNVREVARAIAPRLRAGDLVLTTQPEQVAVLRYYLPAGVRYADPRGRVSDPRLMDWRDASTALALASVDRVLPPLLRNVRAGAHIAVVTPEGFTGTRWAAMVRAHSRTWSAAVEAAPGMRRVLVARADRPGIAYSRVEAVVYGRTRSAAPVTRVPARAARERATTRRTGPP